jgi:hypothetical protein
MVSCGRQLGVAPAEGSLAMIHKTKSTIPGHVRVVFELPSCIWADRIYLTGDFNNWNETDLPLRQDRNGVWQATLDLPLGKRIEFRYLIDGQWRTDSHADCFSENNFGSENSVVVADLPDSDLALDASSLIRESLPQRPFTARVVPQRPAPQPLIHVAA